MGIIKYNLASLLSAFLIGVIIAACDADSSILNPHGETGEVATGTLVGEVTRGPISPVEGEDTPSSEPAPDEEILIMTPGGDEVKSIISDDQGLYSIDLTPSTYVVDIASLDGIEFTKDLPATITITEGQETRLDIHIDTGIR
ncbi:MAG: hypothetical protein WBD99_06255 [Thermodesulfobacteriota bacterium]